MNHLLLIISAIFYSILCVFSIVTGLMYASGKRELNPLELSDKYVEKLESSNSIDAFTKKMGWVTFAVGIVQGITAYSILTGHHFIFFMISVGFTLFSICSVLFKLKGKINLFPALKLIAYAAILIVLVINHNYFLM